MEEKNNLENKDKNLKKLIRMVQDYLKEELKSREMSELPTNPIVIKAISTLKAEDFHLSECLEEIKAHKAPVSYITVFRGTGMNVNIMVLHPGCTIPLHDHPNMFGILKVYLGKESRKEPEAKRQKESFVRLCPIPPPASYFVDHVTYKGSV